MAVVINAETFGARIKQLYDGWRVSPCSPSSCDSVTGSRLFRPRKRHSPHPSLPPLKKKRQKENRATVWNGATALAIPVGAASEDLRYLKSIALQMWLFGYELPGEEDCFSLPSVVAPTPPPTPPMLCSLCHARPSPHSNSPHHTPKQTPSCSSRTRRCTCCPAPRRVEFVSFCFCARSLAGRPSALSRPRQEKTKTRAHGAPPAPLSTTPTKNNNKTVTLLEPLRTPLKEATGADLVLHTRLKGDDGSAAIDALLSAARATAAGGGESAAAVLGSTLKDSHDGALASLWRDKLAAVSPQHIEPVSAAEGVGSLLTAKDAQEGVCVRKAALLASRVLGDYLLPKMETAIDGGKRVKHSKLSGELFGLVWFGFGLGGGGGAANRPPP
jgi:hypothetical protein